MLLVKILAFILVAVEAFMNYGAKWIAIKTGLLNKINITEAQELPPDEMESYRLSKATVRVKLMGLIAFLPGVILIFIAFR